MSTSNTDATDDFVTEDMMTRMSDPEIRAVATDRGYNLDDRVTSKRLRFEFIVAQAADFARRMVGA